MVETGWYADACTTTHSSEMRKAETERESPRNGGFFLGRDLVKLSLWEASAQYAPVVSSPEISVPGVVRRVGPVGKADGRFFD